MPTPQDVLAWLTRFRALVNLDSEGIDRETVTEQGGGVGIVAGWTNSTYKQLLTHLDAWDQLPKANLRPAQVRASLETLKQVTADATTWLTKHAGSDKRSDAPRRAALTTLVQRAKQAEQDARAALQAAEQRHALAQQAIQAFSVIEEVENSAATWARTPPSKADLATLAATERSLLAVTAKGQQALGEAAETVAAHLARTRDLQKRGQLYLLEATRGGGGGAAARHNAHAQALLVDTVTDTDVGPTFLRGDRTLGNLAIKSVVDNADKSTMEDALEEAAHTDVSGLTSDEADLRRFTAYLAAFSDVDKVPKAICALVAAGVEAADGDAAKKRMVAADILCLRWLAPAVVIKHRHSKPSKMLQWVANQADPRAKQQLTPAQEQAVLDAQPGWRDFVDEVVEAAELEVLQQAQAAQATADTLTTRLPSDILSSAERQVSWAKDATEGDCSAVLEARNSLLDSATAVDDSKLDASVADPDAARKQARDLLPLAVRCQAMNMARALDTNPSNVLPTRNNADPAHWSADQLSLLRMFSELEYSEENLNFLLEARQGLGSPERRAELLNRFVKATAPEQVNLPNQLRRSLVADPADDKNWRRVILEIGTLVSRDTLPRAVTVLRTLDPTPG